MNQINAKATLASAQTRDSFNNGFFFGCKGCSSKLFSNKALKSHICFKQDDFVQDLEAFSQVKVLIVDKEQNNSLETLSSTDSSEEKHRNNEEANMKSNPINIENKQIKEQQVNAVNPIHYNVDRTICAKGLLTRDSKGKQMG